MNYNPYHDSYFHKQAKPSATSLGKKHIKDVQDNLQTFIDQLKVRKDKHDLSKVTAPESTSFDKWVPVLESAAKNSDEYKKAKEELDKTWEHHYKLNSHHVEHYGDIKDMCLLDVLEFVADMMAEEGTGEAGEAEESFDKKCKKYEIGDQLKQIILNTAPSLKG